jgi:hypothetical protein
MKLVNAGAPRVTPGHGDALYRLQYPIARRYGNGKRTVIQSLPYPVPTVVYLYQLLYFVVVNFTHYSLLYRSLYVGTVA